MPDSGEERSESPRPVDVPLGEQEAAELPAVSEPESAMANASSPPSAAREQESVAAEGPEPTLSEAADSPGNAANEDPTTVTVELESQPAPAEGPDEREEAVDRPETGGDLEELILPSSIEPLVPLAADARVGPEAAVRIVDLRSTRGRLNVYTAQLTDEAQGEQSIDLVEGPADMAGLQREAELLSQISYAMLPTLYASWVDGNRRYLAVEHIEGATLEESFEAGLPAQTVVSVVLQITQALRRLQAAGWAAVGLSPGGVVMGDPVRLVGLSSAVRIGEVADSAIQISGYSAPELALPIPITGKEDVYTLGALLYRGMSEVPLGEEGPELAGLSSAVRLPGAPQLLAGALAPAEERVDLDEFYRRLLQLKRRLTSSSLALRIAEGTTIGLNPTRVSNEDASGHISWFSACEGRAVCNAVACVVDGMGGMEAGEVASTAALRAVLTGAASYAGESIAAAPGSDSLEDPAPSSSLDPADLIQAAAEAVYAAARGRQVGATITCVAIEDGQLQLGHVGDTRAYLVRHGILTQLTRDHSLVATMVSSGVITAEEARGHPESNKVLRALGSHRTLPDEYVDGLEQGYGEPFLHLQPGDLVVLCSDGVWGQVEDETLLHLCDSPDPETAVRAVLQAAVDAGAPDNASVVIVRCYRAEVG